MAGSRGHSVLAHDPLATGKLTQEISLFCALLPQVPRSLPRQITVQLDFRKPVLENAAHYTAVVKAIRI